MKERPRADSWFGWDDWPPSPLSGSAQYVSGDAPDDAPVILVPDGKGDYCEHRVIERAKGRMGFR